MRLFLRRKTLAFRVAPCAHDSGATSGLAWMRLPPQARTSAEFPDSELNIDHGMQSSLCVNTWLRRFVSKSGSNSSIEVTMASELIKHTNDADFEQDVLKSGVPVLVDFWAEWCGPCRMIGPTLDEMASEYQGKLAIMKVNVDENRSIPAKFGIRGIPTLLLFKNGELAGNKVGAASKSQLTAFVDAHL
jgi:thioredoxin 1